MQKRIFIIAHNYIIKFNIVIRTLKIHNLTDINLYYNSYQNLHNKYKLLLLKIWY